LTTSLNLDRQIDKLPTLTHGGRTYLAYTAVTDTVAAFLFPDHPLDSMDEAAYRLVLETADRVCRQLGYTAVTRLTPPAVPLPATGLYWTRTEAVQHPPAATEQDEDEMFFIDARTSVVEDLSDGRLVDARIAHLQDISRRYYKIPVTLTDAVYDLIQKAVANRKWHNDERGVWHDILGMSVMVGRDVNPGERRFKVIITGAGNKRYWDMKVLIKYDDTNAPYLVIALADEPDRDPNKLFELGHCVATDGAAALGINLTPYLARHAAGDWGDLDNEDKRQNNRAVKQGQRILSSYNLPPQRDDDGHEWTEKLWIITEADRSRTTLLLPDEY
jgi:hypothetical protein